MKPYTFTKCTYDSGSFVSWRWNSWEEWYEARCKNHFNQFFSCIKLVDDHVFSIINFGHWHMKSSTNLILVKTISIQFKVFLFSYNFMSIFRKPFLQVFFNPRSRTKWRRKGSKEAIPCQLTSCLILKWINGSMILYLV